MRTDRQQSACQLIRPVWAVKAKPAGSLPLETDQVYGGVPPIADSTWV